MPSWQTGIVLLIGMREGHIPCDTKPQAYLGALFLAKNGIADPALNFSFALSEGRGYRGAFV
jgi:hypothetical protein